MKKYAIIENEKFARINLQNAIFKLRPDYECVFTAETIEDCIDYFSGRPDLQLIFMDIELDDGNCFEIFRSVEIDTPIIFTTAYDEYAIRAFKVNSVDYLLKPLQDSDLERALKKFESHSQGAAPIKAAKSEKEAPKLRTRLLVSNGQNYTFVQDEEIAWFEAEDRYVYIICKNGKSLISDFSSIGEIAAVLDPNRFFQISRSILASIDAIKNVSKYFKGRLNVTLEASEHSKTEVISAARRDTFLEWLGHTHK
ncbi:MAG: response regulator transcription factor [Bacteroides sp.]|nr:response regulator transcription factor [Bacteroides sp.]MBD5330232.1 response regulator transcription factor [Bacteroides sp.]